MNSPQVAVTPADVDTLMSDWVVGKILSEPAITGVESLSAVSIYFDCGQGHERHSHAESDQLIYVISGEADMMIEFEEGQPKTQRIRSGDLVTIPKGAYHSTFNVGWEPVRILTVYSPAGPETAMRSSADFTMLPAGEVPHRRGTKE